MPTPITETFKAFRKVLLPKLKAMGLTMSSAGTRDEALSEAVDSTSGYFKRIGKSPRWIIQIVEDGGQPKARLAQDAAGNEIHGARNLGAINNTEGTSAVTVFRVKPALRKGATYSFPDWEWLLVLGLPAPLPAGTSSDTLSDFDTATGRFLFGARNSYNNYTPAKLALIKCDCSGIGALENINIDYDKATQAVANMLGAQNNPPTITIIDSKVNAQLTQLANDLVSAINTASPSIVKAEIEPLPELLGVPSTVYRQINAALKSGKKHLIFYGPPGTGKTTIAQYVADTLAGGKDTEMLTASSSWTSQDIVGGYQPKGGGEIVFVPGAVLRNLDRPIVIDELNRCPIDKVIGPLFSVLSNQTSTLPYRQDVSKADSPFHVIYPDSRPNPAAHEWCPSSDWRILATLNTVDKTQLGQFSYALSRRFAWIKIGIPEDLSAFVEKVIDNEGLSKTSTTPQAPGNPLADLWAEVNKTRELGGAPYIDFIKAAGAMKGDLAFLEVPSPEAQDIFLDCLEMFILPLLDGIRRTEAASLADGIKTIWGLDAVRAQRVLSSLQELVA